jgi:hypothetical protein
MNTKDKLLNVVRVYRAYGESHARARLVYHGWRVDEPARLEAMLGAVRELVERTATATPAQELPA